MTDFYSFNGYYNTLPNNIRKTFAENHNQIIISENQDYVVTIRDEGKWNTKAKEYLQGAKDNENSDSQERQSYDQQRNDFKKYIAEFYDTNAEEKTYNLSYQYALFKVAGEYMNFFTVNTVDAIIKVEPYNMDANGNKIKINCNN